MKHHSFRKLHIVLLLLTLTLTACGSLPGGGGASGSGAGAVSDVDGNVRVTADSGVMEFQVVSGLTSERLSGVRVRVEVIGFLQMLYAEDSTGQHLSVAVPITGDQTVRRLIMPPRPEWDTNIATAGEAPDFNDLPILNVLSEADLRTRLNRMGDTAVLIYVYDPERPLALTGAALEIYETPFDNVFVVKPPGESGTGLVVVSLGDGSYANWSHLAVDRYLAARVGVPPATDLRGDLTFGWAYPVFEVFPTESILELDEGDSLTLRVNWRSTHPDPPPPWQFFVSVAGGGVTVEPDSFTLQPGDPPQEITISIDRTLLLEGDYQREIFIQPFSETFGLIEQGVGRVITFTVAETIPTPTPGPSIDVFIDPVEPHEGGSLRITASGFLANENVLVEFIGEQRTISDGLAMADTNGDFAYDLDLRNTPAGAYTLRITGAETGITGSLIVDVDSKPPDALVNTGELNIRTGPGYDYPVIEIVVNGDELTVVGTNADDTWLEIVTTTGYRGWALTNLLEVFIDLSTVPWNPNVPPPPN